MIKECEIVQDLLFGYSDCTLSNSSKELVEKHVKECDSCKKILEEIEEDKEKQTINNDEVDYLKKINKKLNKKTILFVITSLLLVIIVSFNIIVFENYKRIAENVEIFLFDDITNEQLCNIEKEIKNIYAPAKITYKSKKDALEQLKEQFGDKANLLDGYEEENILPASYKIKVKINVIKQIKEKIEKMPGVEKVTILDENPYVVFYFSKLYR